MTTGAGKKTVVIGAIGSTLDRASGPQRWARWRPTVAACQHDDLLVSRFELLHDPRSASLATDLRKDIAQVSPETEVRLVPLGFGDAWDFSEVYSGLYDWVRSYPFDLEREDYLVHLTTGTHVMQICWFLLTEARYIPGRLLQTSPASQTRSRDSSTAGQYGIVDLDLSRYSKLATRLAAEQDERVDFLKSGIATRNAAFNAMMEQMEKVALRSTHPILLMGPTGAGKSMLAARIHALRKERAGLTGKYVDVNCATLRGDHAMSTLFGHRRGAFTGAQTDRPGLLREAHGGILFLDEIGELGPDEQAMLLRALEDHTFFPMGSDTPAHSDFQLIAGTNKDLRAAVAAGDFREDLLARINLWTFTLPSLAERREDIAANLDYELERLSREQGRQVRFHKEAREKFLAFSHSSAAVWSSNFRDLNAAVVRMATLAPAGRITVDCVASEMQRLLSGWQRPGNSANSSLTDEQRAAYDPVDLVQLEYVIGVCRASRTQSEAGRALYAVSRTQKTSANDADRLRKYLARFDLTWASVQTGSEPS